MYFLSQSKGQYKYLVVFLDLFTRWIETKPLQKGNRRVMVEAFQKLVLFQWESPDILLTNKGNDFDKKNR